MDFFDYGGLYQFRFAGGGEKFADFLKGEFDNLGTGFVDEGFRGADHEFDVAGRLRG
jgi:hypothetical protein